MGGFVRSSFIITRHFSGLVGSKEKCDCQDQKRCSVMADKHVPYGTCPVNRTFHLSEHAVAEGPPTAGRHGTGHAPVYYGNKEQ